MKNALLLLPFILLFLSCGVKGKNGSQTAASSTAETLQTEIQKDRIEVLYFHNPKRCPNCIAIEENTRAALEEQFSSQLKTGDILFQSVDLSQKENAELIEKYQAKWSSLFIVGHKNGKSTFRNMTLFAFSHARMAPDSFKKEIVKTIQEMMN